MARPGAVVTPVARGAAGRIWCLDLDGDRYAVKELLEEPDEDSVDREVAFTTHLAAAGIRLPAALRAPGGRFVVPRDGNSGGWLRLYRWIDGVPADLADAGLAARIGDLLGRLHALAPPATGIADPWYDQVPEADTWDQLADAARREGAGWAKPMAERIGLLRLLADLVTPAADDRLVTCHRDLHPDNVLVESSGELSVLDWDDAGPACPDRELAALLMFWHASDDGTAADDTAIQRTLAAYRAAGGPGQLRDQQSFGMYIAGRLNFLQGQASVALDALTAPADRQYAASEIIDTLARLPAPSLISRLISLARSRPSAPGRLAPG